jgi:hypothetical protein
MANVTPINIPFPEAETLHLRLATGGCRLRIVPGDGPDWVSGTYDDPTNAVPLQIQQEDGNVRLYQSFNWPQAWGRIGQPPTFDLTLGKSKPYALTLEGGASESTIDLGGLPINRLAIRYGAGKQDVNFSAPNPQPMTEFTIAAGAAGLFLKNLANANPTTMFVEGGAAGYSFDFGGTLQRDASVRITAGMSSVEIRIPATTAARINPQTVLGSVDVGDGLMKKEGAFWTEAALAGQQPLLTIAADVTMGSINLVAT